MNGSREVMHHAAVRHHGLRTYAGRLRFQLFGRARVPGSIDGTVRGSLFSTASCAFQRAPTRRAFRASSRTPETLPCRRDLSDLRRASDSPHAPVPTPHVRAHRDIASDHAVQVHAGAATRDRAPDRSGAYSRCRSSTPATDSIRRGNRAPSGNRDPPCTWRSAIRPAQTMACLARKRPPDVPAVTRFSSSWSASTRWFSRIRAPCSCASRAMVVVMPG